MFIRIMCAVIVLASIATDQRGPLGKQHEAVPASDSTRLRSITTQGPLPYVKTTNTGRTITNSRLLHAHNKHISKTHGLFTSGIHMQIDVFKTNRSNTTAQSIPAIPLIGESKDDTFGPKKAIFSHILDDLLNLKNDKRGRINLSEGVLNPEQTKTKVLHRQRRVLVRNKYFGYMSGILKIKMLDSPNVFWALTLLAQKSTPIPDRKINSVHISEARAVFNDAGEKYQGNTSYKTGRSGSSSHSDTVNGDSYGFIRPNGVPRARGSYDFKGRNRRSKARSTRATRKSGEMTKFRTLNITNGKSLSLSSAGRDFKRRKRRQTAVSSSRPGVAVRIQSTKDMTSQLRSLLIKKTANSSWPNVAEEYVYKIQNQHSKGISPRCARASGEINKAGSPIWNTRRLKSGPAPWIPSRISIGIRLGIQDAGPADEHVHELNTPNLKSKSLNTSEANYSRTRRNSKPLGPGMQGTGEAFKFVTHNANPKSINSDKARPSKAHRDSQPTLPNMQRTLKEPPRTRRNSKPVGAGMQRTPKEPLRTRRNSKVLGTGMQITLQEPPRARGNSKPIGPDVQRTPAEPLGAPRNSQTKVSEMQQNAKEPRNATIHLQTKVPVMQENPKETSSAQKPVRASTQQALTDDQKPETGEVDKKEEPDKEMRYYSGEWWMWAFVCFMFTHPLGAAFGFFFVSALHRTKYNEWLLCCQENKTQTSTASLTDCTDPQTHRDDTEDKLHGEHTKIRHLSTAVHKASIQDDDFGQLQFTRHSFRDESDKGVVYLTLSDWDPARDADDRETDHEKRMRFERWLELDKLRSIRGEYTNVESKIVNSDESALSASSIGSAGGTPDFTSQSRRNDTLLLAIARDGQTQNDLNQLDSNVSPRQSTSIDGLHFMLPEDPSVFGAIRRANHDYARHLVGERSTSIDNRRQSSDPKDFRRPSYRNDVSQARKPISNVVTRPEGPRYAYNNSAGGESSRSWSVARQRSGSRQKSALGQIPARSGQRSPSVQRSGSSLIPSQRRSRSRKRRRSRSGLEDHCHHGVRRSCYLGDKCPCAQYHLHHHVFKDGKHFISVVKHLSLL